MTLIRFFVEKGANVNARAIYDDLTPLHIVVRNGNLEAVELLLDKGAAINKFCVEEIRMDSYTPLHIAAYMGNTEALKILLKEGADIENSAMNLEKEILDIVNAAIDQQ